MRREQGSRPTLMIAKSRKRRTPVHEWRCIYPGSSSVRFVAYNPADATLRVEFAGGNAYEYAHVPEAVYREFVAAESHGAYFNRCIRGRFAGRKIFAAE